MKILKTYFFLILFSINGIVNAQPESLRLKLRDFFISVGEWNDFHERTVNESDDDAFCYVVDLVTHVDLKHQDCGIFGFGIWTTHTINHILIKSKGQYTFVNMYNTNTVSLMKILLDFMEENYYTEREVHDYLEAALNLIKSNSIVSPWGPYDCYEFFDYDVYNLYEDDEDD